MKLEQLLLALQKRGVSQAALRAGNEMQIFVDGAWRAQSANLTNESLDAMIAEAVDVSQRASWDSNEARAQLELQGFSIVARKSAGQVQIAIKSQNAAPLQSQNAPAPASTSVFAPAPTTTAPAPAKAANWFHIDENTEKGPFDVERFKAMVQMGTLGPQTLVWREGMSNWEPISNTELASVLPVVAAPIAPPIASPTGAGFQPQRGQIGQNDSGSGEMALVPPGVGGFNWGAFLLPVFWGFAHNQSGRAWAIFGTGFIPCVGGLVSLYLSIVMANEGNAIAWKHRRWDSVEHLQNVQRIWLNWGLGVVGVGIALFILSLLLGGSS